MRVTKDFSFRGHTYHISCVETTPQHASWFSFVDEQSVRDASWDVQPGEVIIDVGAAYGSYSLSALACGAAQVFAWSPQGEPAGPSERELFLESLALNGWQDRAEVYDFGLYNQTGWLDTVSQTLSQEAPEDQGPNSPVIRVQTLDSWYEATVIPKAPGYWLKMDVEGAEVEVLHSGKKLIESLRPRILVENHNFKRATIEQEVRDLLLSWGYREVSTTPYHSVSHSVYVPT